jgi:Domain of unknown function (DUF4136)
MIPLIKIEEIMKRLILILFFAAIAQSCTRNLHVEREPNVLIEQYKSYTWNKLEATNASHPFYHSAELNQLIIREIDKKLAKKGFKRNAVSPDFLVDFHIYVEEQKFQNLVCGAGFYRGERYLPELRDKTYCESPEIVNYDDGTLIIDIVDAQTKQLVWRASMSDIIDNPNYSGKIFSKKVNQIFKKFPIQKKTKTNLPEVEKQISIR